MARADDIDAILAQLGPDEPDIEAVVRLGTGSTMVRFDDLDVEITFDETLNRLMMQADIGEIRANRTEMMGVLLTYGLLWQDTGAVRMAMNSDEHVVLMADLFGDETNLRLLAAMLGNFATKARVWRTVLATGEPPMREDPLAAVLSYGIRV